MTKMEFEHNAHIVDTTHRIIQEVTATNQAYEASADIRPRPLLKVVQSDIADRQLDQFHELLTQWVSVPAEDIGIAALRAAGALTLAEEEDRRLSEERESSIGVLQDNIALALELAPNQKAEIKKIEQQEVQKIATKYGSTVLDSLRKEDAAAQERVALYGTAWPIPRALSAEDRITLYDLIKEEGAKNKTIEFEEDLIPVTPEERIHQAEVAERAKRSIENKEASHYLTYYLAEREGKVVTVEELARFLYVANVDERRTNVTTLLGPKIQGKRIQRMLAQDYGLSLQYGWRKLKREDGGRLIEVRRTRIYRAVDIQDPDRYQQYPTTQLDSNRSVFDELDTPVVYQRQDVDTGEIPVQAEHGVVTVSPYSEVEPMTDQVAVFDSNIAEKEQPEDWILRFAEEADAEIERLINDRLFEEDEIRGTIIRALGSSSKLGTETMRQRMKEAGLMKLGELKADMMTREQRVIGALFNVHQNILGQRGKKQKEAITIVKDRIENALQNLANEATK